MKDSLPAAAPYSARVVLDDVASFLGRDPWISTISRTSEAMPAALPTQAYVLIDLIKAIRSGGMSIGQTSARAA